jgi:hypothetical protein
MIESFPSDAIENIFHNHWRRQCTNGETLDLKKNRIIDSPSPDVNVNKCRMEIWRILVIPLLVTLQISFNKLSDLALIVVGRVS